ncbi:MAG TPA: UDP-N-acetylmuramoyl-tripeptide--D-alanyl-D-alanine ligase [Saprospiraceae bacterium]|nr:UDP-N-acetylmuramoyl-tripeptide--D-alanyl-D-alanine ligase [Saprospiraceae bacterium]HMQ84100.1 UDP-N-acetylmuramoyl-tripeptide--D-alanyl-D-alanine ligase [Saprospiraceae bacterium]
MISIEHLYDLYLAHPVISTDSRKVSPDSLFFALKGTSFDGNRFAAQALASGAAYAIVDDESVVENERFLLVEDVLKALQDLAHHHRMQLHIPVIAITGSNGKTTTKELVAAVLSAHYPAFATKGNLNNHIGVPLSLLSIGPITEVAVIEMGANHQGEIDFLCQIAAPSHGLITNIGKAHLEGFGGIEGVKKGKSELYRWLASSNGTAFINRDEAFLEELAKPVTKKVFYKRSDQPSLAEVDLEIKLLATQPFIRAAFLDRKSGHLQEVNTQLFGAYNFNNVMTAIALGKYFKVPAEKIIQAIEAYIPSNNRSQLVEMAGNRFVLDAYNANPSSMRQAILSFRAMEGKNKIAILGDMLELGEESLSEHEQIVQLAQAQHFDQVILVGANFRKVAEQHELLHFPNVTSLKGWFVQQGFSDRYFLIKGSRGMQLERLLMETE